MVTASPRHNNLLYQMIPRLSLDKWSKLDDVISVHSQCRDSPHPVWIGLNRVTVNKFTSSQLLNGPFIGQATLVLLLPPLRTVVSTTGGAKNGLEKLTFCKKVQKWMNVCKAIINLVLMTQSNILTASRKHDFNHLCLHPRTYKGEEGGGWWGFSFFFFFQKKESYSTMLKLSVAVHLSLITMCPWYLMLSWQRHDYKQVWSTIVNFNILQFFLNIIVRFVIFHI